MTQSKRLEALISALDMSIRQFEIEIGVGSATIDKAIKRNSTLGFGTVQKIIRKYAQINQDWLEKGIGDMFINPTTPKRLPAKPSEIEPPYKKPQNIYGISAELWDYLTNPKRSIDDILEAEEVLRKLIEKAKKEKE